MQKTKEKAAPEKETSMESPQVVSTATDWKGKCQETEKLNLPSGVTVEIKRKIGIFDCAVSGHIPMALFHHVVDVGGKMKSKEKGWDDISEEDLQKMMEVLRKVATVAVVKPKVSLEPQDGEMDAAIIPEEDLIVIFSKMMEGGGAFTLKAFR